MLFWIKWNVFNLVSEKFANCGQNIETFTLSTSFQPNRTSFQSINLLRKIQNNTVFGKKEFFFYNKQFNQPILTCTDKEVFEKLSVPRKGKLFYNSQCYHGNKKFDVSKVGICSWYNVSATLKIQTPTTSTEIIAVRLYLHAEWSTNQNRISFVSEVLHGNMFTETKNKP